MKREAFGGSWKTSEVCETTTGEIDVLVEAMAEPSRLPSVQVARSYKHALTRARVSDPDDEAVTIPLAVMR